MCPERQAPDPVDAVTAALDELAILRRGRGARPHGPHGRGPDPWLRGEPRARGREGHPGWRDPGDGPVPPMRGHGAGPGGHRGHDEPLHGLRGPRGPRTLGVHRVLEVLAASPVALSITDVGLAIGVDQPRASRLVQSLQAEGLVRREPDPLDARRSIVVLTERGRAHVAERRARRAAPVAVALAALEPDEREQLAALLTRLAAAWPRP